MDSARDSGTRPRPSLKQRLARWLTPPRTLRPTRAGWIFFAITFGVGFAALNTGNNLLYLVLALMLAFLALSGVMSESALRGIEVQRRLPRELFAEASGTVALEISNHQRRVPAFAIVVEDLWKVRDDDSCVAGRTFALRIGPGERQMRGYRLRPERRGISHFSGFRVSTRFPFGLFSKARTLEAPEKVLVFPAVEQVAVPAQFGEARRAGEHVIGSAGSGVDAAGLREYAPGDSLRRIHWRASARANELLVRDVESDHEAEIEVLLRTADCDPGENFECRVRWAASEVIAFLDQGTHVALRTDAVHIPPANDARHRAHLLSFLAEVEPA